METSDKKVYMHSYATTGSEASGDRRIVGSMGTEADGGPYLMRFAERR